MIWINLILPTTFASSNSLSTSEAQTMIIEVLLLVVLLGALLYRLLSISASQWSLIDGVIKGRNNYIHWKLSANLRWIAKSFDKWERLGIPHDKPTFPYGSHNSLDGKREFPDDHFFFITITLFLSYSQWQDNFTRKHSHKCNSQPDGKNASFLKGGYLQKTTFLSLLNFVFLLLAMFHSQLLRKETHERVHNWGLQKVQAGAGPQNSWMVPVWKTSS